VLFLREFKVSRSLCKTLRRVRRDGSWRVTLDAAFARVMQACAAPRPDQEGTWITPEVVAAYSGLHRLGNAHSIEVWEGRTLIGGLYGVTIGRMFYGESMFARRSDASKCALAALVRLIEPLGYRMIDCQQSTGHLASLGAREISRAEFLSHLAELTAEPAPDWRAAVIEFPDA
jgi:leucyl/phenylalanyl-tRNA---protein transferase